MNERDLTDEQRRWLHEGFEFPWLKAPAPRQDTPDSADNRGEVSPIPAETPSDSASIAPVHVSTVTYPVWAEIEALPPEERRAATEAAIARMADHALRDVAYQAWRAAVGRGAA